MFNIEFTAVVLFFAIIILPLQTLLCFRINNILIRLLPVIILSVTTIIFTVMSLIFNGWDGIALLFIAIFSGVMLFMCGIGWGIWAIARFIENKKQ